MIGAGREMEKNLEHCGKRERVDIRSSLEEARQGEMMCLDMVVKWI
jgi:hypothetical protein